MDPILQYKAQLAAAIADRDSLIDRHVAAGLAAGAGFTPEQTAEIEAAKAKVAGIETALKVAEDRRAQQKREAEEAARSGNTRVEVDAPNFAKDPKRGFADHREFFGAVIKHGNRPVEAAKDERLKMLAAVGSDEQGEYSDQYGGFGLPEALLPGVKELGSDADPTAGLTTNLPMQATAVKILAKTDKNHTSSVSGGLQFSRRPETGAFSAQRASMELIRFEANTLAGAQYFTEELIQDSPATVAALMSGWRAERDAAIFNEKLRGTGTGEYLGILDANSAATISVAKETGQAAASIVADNVLKMRARCWRYGGAIWLANHDTYPQLAKLAIPVGVGGQLIYQHSMVEDRPDMLLGRPIYYNEFPETVGTVGDLILGVWSEYLEGIYSPLQTAESIHVRFVNHERTIKMWERNTGACWWRAAITPKKGANTISPFVTLATRS